MQDENCARNAVASDDAKVLGEKSHGDSLVDKSWGNLFCNWKALSIAALLGVVGGIAVYFFVPQKWQATLVVRVGKAMVSVEPDRTLQEEMAYTAEWLRSEEFFDALIASIGYPAVPAGENEPADVKLLRESLQSKEIPGSQLLRVDFLGYSTAQLKKYADVITKEVFVSHEKFLKAQQEKSEVAREKNESKLAAEESEYQRLRMEYSLVAQQPQESQVQLASALVKKIQSRGELIDALRKIQRDLDRRIFFARLYPAVVSQAEIYEKPVLPKIRGFLLGGILVGFLCGFIYLTLRKRTLFFRVP